MPYREPILCTSCRPDGSCPVCLTGPTGHTGLAGPTGPTLNICPRCHTFAEFHRDDLCVALGGLIDRLREFNGVDSLRIDRPGLKRSGEAAP